MKTESIAEFLKRGGKITKGETPPPEEKVLTADITEKAQPSFYEQPAEEIIAESFGLPLETEVDNDNEDE